MAIINNNPTLSGLLGRRGQQFVIPVSPYFTSLLRCHCGFNIVGARTGIRPIGCTFSKNVKKFNKTRTGRAGTVREFRYTKVHYKDTCNDHQQATEDGRRARQVSSVRAATDATGHRATTNSEADGQCEDASAYGKGLRSDD
ncbi:MAG: hypothetical protein EZS28_029160 [Streblomastix strix]|uniref:Uncharacterized protein n=1 Tax=Streblomastix strix TaxID=222440 RepID=A0A5J4UZS1_9EUKA|nr:MAG: hypothetical protein EZS28_029160 [Streblomastix strix]